MRYLPHSEADRAAMLATIGAASVEDLFRDVPREALDQAAFDALPDHGGEMEVERALSALAARNLTAGSVPCFLGAGSYRHHVPAAVDALIQRGEFLTSYTPYQAEVSQGTLQYLFEFQTQVALITGMEVANASMYDGATACAEAAAMAVRITRRRKVLMAGGLHPHYTATTQTLLACLGHEGEGLPPDPLALGDLIGRVGSDTACVIVQNPDFFGRLRDLSPLAEACHAAGALLVVAVCEPVSLGLVAPPGAMGADIVVAEGHALGSPTGFGGPGVGLFATREKYLRQMPGRLAGETLDESGKRGYVLTLSTREQHIRREKATSNICTNSGLIALAFTIHMTLLGEAGFTRLAWINHANAVALAEKLARVKGVKVLPETFFNEFTLRLPKPAAEVVEALAARSILAGVPVSRFLPTYPELANLLLVNATELTTPEDADALVAALKEVL
ncbi:aminomethyl-transferring glycine dehydrogenase subunit GcvPA [Rhodospirillum rubrum]|uniref:Probable glycine dehydrogenase (decarboxylating) subunit 1 n=1 Tax=Rhodospirillum rubrum (strain ATCC 11170 / ATH 1.1.1 / DSM 467 / LMG 4362 / NCIMB 8255 / S1) TaxID=269796 RepID=GCSPA_RHORT|nr:aminomethyl-transferring glycine dehydrogenase subunit GcvPA [Rhodospirillum rubrum]Q2RPV1.1 RecName: Full=Probable glycine dehydrogenase (decarboxylating) subunit 1; AltName: Full=Glycine cleavage system P-protein subunit 1; AltName: Full=Glycine decarboxylase subunit 1; AltName: Full=Glycine dehydrogenase (aminomethyl-transferring) subunit 1 [Rhodospirillum rubrum ATCC 11170]ABC23844.1 glycine dehydrogenase (decarboxylating) alpha subunit [Rhodospirillum rubrum ATCC 11170]AEO49586.1 glycine